MNLNEAGAAWAAFAPHVVSVALISARLLPITFLCPLFGGAAAPQSVKLGWVLSLALGLHGAAGISTAEQVATPWLFAALAGREAVLGVSLGLVAGLPFDAARMGGRFIDLFRGTSAEAALPLTGTRDSATSDGLYQLVTAMAMTGLGFPIVLSALFHSFALVKLGAFIPTEDAAHGIVRLAMTALGGGLAIGAPIAGLALAADALLGLLSRAAPQMNLQDAGAPLKILGGGAVLWLGIGVLTERALAAVAVSGDQMLGLLRGAP